MIATHIDSQMDISRLVTIIGDSASDAIIIYLPTEKTAVLSYILSRYCFKSMYVASLWLSDDSVVANRVWNDKFSLMENASRTLKG